MADGMGPWDPTATRLTYPRLARLRWVFDLSAAQALVLAAIAERDFDYDTRQRPGVVSIVTAEVCEEVGITSRTLRAALERLHGAGLIEVVDRGQGRVGATVRPLYGAMLAVWARDIPALKHLPCSPHDEPADEHELGWLLRAGFDVTNRSWTRAEAEAEMGSWQ